MELQLTTAPRVRALCLLSGGLDSRLAVCVLRAQGIETHAVVFDSPFFTPKLGIEAADALGIPLHVIEFTADIFELVRNPPHGFGKCMNPCIDCHARMLRRAGDAMGDLDADFLATGEVLDQRPMSQNRTSLNIVARASGYAELIVRPLSARRLPPSRPERDGRVDRERLLDLVGRGRKPQMALAKAYGLEDYPSPAGGCRLTEPNFCVRLRDLLGHEGVAAKRDIDLLRYGRHFRIENGIKVIVGRNEQDNAYLEGHAGLYDVVLNVEGIPGPVGLLPNTAGPAHIERAASICARYSDAAPDDPVVIRVRSTRGMHRIEARPAEVDVVDRLRL